MRNIKNRLLSILFLLIFICTNFSTFVLAAEPEEVAKVTCYNVEVTSEGISSISVIDEYGNELEPAIARSSISGYEQGTLSSDPAGIQVIVDASGFGGMGVTIKASSSWNGYMSLDILGSDGNAAATEKAVYSNGETYFNNLFHFSPMFYLFSFRGIPKGESVFVQIWVYG